LLSATAVDRYSATARLFHWLTALLVVVAHVVSADHTAVAKPTVVLADLTNAEWSARAKIADALPNLKVEPVGDSFALCRMPKNGTMYLEPGIVAEPSTRTATPSTHTCRAFTL
jgi:hypothetical protein